MLLSHHVYILNLLGILCSVLDVGVITFLPRELGCPSKMAESLHSSTGGHLLSDSLDLHEESSEGIFEEPRGTENISHIIVNSWKTSLVAATSLFRVTDPTFTVLWIFSIFSFTTRVEVLNPQYISLTLGWPLSSVNSILAIKALVSACVLFALPTIRRRYLEPRMNSQQADLLVIQASLFLNCIGMAGLGFPLPALLFITALCIYTSGNGLYDSLTTYGRATLPEDEEMGDFFVRSGLVQTIAGLVAAPVWTGLFSLCLQSSFLPIGLPFGISAGLFGATLLLARSLQGQALYSTDLQGA